MTTTEHLDRFDITLAAIDLLGRLPEPSKAIRDDATLERVLQLLAEAVALLAPDQVDAALIYFKSDISLLRCHLRTLEIRQWERTGEKPVPIHDGTDPFDTDPQVGRGTRW